MPKLQEVSSVLYQALLPAGKLLQHHKGRFHAIYHPRIVIQEYFKIGRKKIVFSLRQKKRDFVSQSSDDY